MNKNVTTRLAACSKSPRAINESPPRSLGQATAKFYCCCFPNASRKLPIFLHSFHLTPSRLRLCSGAYSPLPLAPASLLPPSHPFSAQQAGISESMQPGHIHAQHRILHGFPLGLGETAPSHHVLCSQALYKGA